MTELIRKYALRRCSAAFQGHNYDTVPWFQWTGGMDLIFLFSECMATVQLHFFFPFPLFRNRAVAQTYCRPSNCSISLKGWVNNRVFGEYVLNGIKAFSVNRHLATPDWVLPPPFLCRFLVKLSTRAHSLWLMSVSLSLQNNTTRQFF